MPYVESAHDQIGLAFSIVGLILVVPSVFLFKQYNRFLDHCQMLLLFWMCLAPTSTTFASHLDESWSNFIPNFLTFCSPGQIVCELGFALSWTICLLGVILILLIIVTFQKCRKPDLRFEPVYSVFKGFFKWTYIPMAYYSVHFLIEDIKNGTRVNFIPSIVIFGWCIIFPIYQLIYYKVIQQETDQIWTKWFQFLGYYRQLLAVVIFLASKLAENGNSSKQYLYDYVFAPLIVYALLHLWKGVYVNKVIDRVMFVLEEVVMIGLFSLFLYDPQDLIQYDLDFFGLAFILLLNVINITIKLVSWLVYGKLQQSEVNPELQDDKNKANGSLEHLELSNSNDFGSKRKNKYEDVGNDLLGSRESLNSSIRRGNQRRRR